MPVCAPQHQSTEQSQQQPPAAIEPIAGPSNVIQPSKTEESNDAMETISSDSSGGPTSSDDEEMKCPSPVTIDVKENMKQTGAIRKIMTATVSNETLRRAVANAEADQPPKKYAAIGTGGSRQSALSVAGRSDRKSATYLAVANALLDTVGIPANRTPVQNHPPTIGHLILHIKAELEQCIEALANNDKL